MSGWTAIRVPGVPGIEAGGGGVEREQTKRRKPSQERRDADMMRMNKVLLVGNLTRDPVLRKTPAGVACVDLGLAVNESYTGKDGKPQETACFVDVVAWEKQAEACREYLRKGAPVFVEGRLQYDHWEDKEGQKRNRIRVRADRVQFMGRPGGAGERAAEAPAARREERGEARPERARRLPLED